MQRRKVWVSVGAAVFVASQVAPPSKSLAGGLVPGRPLVLAAQGGEGGEGGEAGAAYDAKLPRTLRFFRNIQLIRGHLLVGNELVAQGRWAEALPHFLHPSEEIYPKIRDDLQAYSVAPFAAALKALAQTVRAKNQGAYRTALAGVEERLARADKGVRDKEQNWPSFVVETILEVLGSAAGEYEEAIENGRIAKPIEYQDARGFVWQADKLLGSVGPDLAAKDADAVQAAQAAFADLKQAWPSPLPPKAPVKDLSAVLAGMSKIELQIGRFR